MPRMKPIAAFGAAAIAMTLVAGPAQAEGEYGVLMKTLANPFWGAMGQGVEDGAKEAGVEYFLQAVESDQAAESQLNVCNTMLERSPVAMITAAINSTNLLPCLKSAQEAGIKVVVDGAGPSAGKIRAMVESGAVVWDVCDSGPGSAIILGERGITQPIDYSIVDKANIIEPFTWEFGCANYFYSYTLCCNPTMLKAVPQNWADVWNVKDFPGKRTFRKSVRGMLEPAAMAMGAAPDEVYEFLGDEAGIKAAIQKYRDWLHLEHPGASAERRDARRQLHHDVQRRRLVAGRLGGAEAQSGRHGAGHEVHRPQRQSGTAGEVARGDGPRAGKPRGRRPGA